MPGIIVSDTSCLIILDKLGRIGLLKSLFGRITITKIVADEFRNVLPEFVEIENPKNKNYQKIKEIGKTDFRINEKLINEVKRKSGE